MRKSFSGNFRPFCRKIWGLQKGGETSHPLPGKLCHGTFPRLEALSLHSPRTGAHLWLQIWDHWVPLQTVLKIPERVETWVNLRRRVWGVHLIYCGQVWEVLSVPAFRVWESHSGRAWKDWKRGWEVSSTLAGSEIYSKIWEEGKVLIDYHVWWLIWIHDSVWILTLRDGWTLRRREN